MATIKGFETKEAAKKYQRKHGGTLCYKNARKWKNSMGYLMAVFYDGLDDKKYPYCLRWEE